MASAVSLGGGITAPVIGARQAKHRKEVIRKLKGVSVVPDHDGGGALVVHGRF